MRQWIGWALLQIMAVAYLVPNHYLNQCWFIVNWTLRNKFQWNFSQKSNYFIQENAFENVICEMATILSRGKWVNTTMLTFGNRFTIKNWKEIIPPGPSHDPVFSRCHYTGHIWYTPTRATSSRCLHMSWRQIGTRSSAITTLTRFRLYCYMKHIVWYITAINELISP